MEPSSRPAASLYEVGKIVSASLGSANGEGLKVIDAKGMSAMPGFIDAHKHINTGDLIRGGSEVVGAAAAISGGALFAQQATGPGSQHATSSGLAGRTIKALVRRPQGASVQQVKLWTLVTIWLRSELRHRRAATPS